MSVEARLRRLGIELPNVTPAVANYLPYQWSGNQLFLSGHGPIRGGAVTSRGKLGRDLTVDEGYAIAREVGLNLLGTTRAALGTLDRVERVVKAIGMINSAEGFTEQPRVMNGFSDLMVEVFGEAGRHARSAFGAAELPFGIPVEIEAIFEVKGATR